MSWTTGRHNDLLLGLMILYQLLRELLRMGKTKLQTYRLRTLHATGTQTLLRPQARLQQVRVAQMGTFWAWGHTGTPAGGYSSLLAKTSVSSRIKIGHMYLGPALINQTQIRKEYCYNQMGPSEPQVTQARLQEVTNWNLCFIKIGHTCTWIQHGDKPHTDQKSTVIKVAHVIRRVLLYSDGGHYYLQQIQSSPSLAPNMLCMLLVIKDMPQVA